jgi:hypothetical protein
MEGAWRDDHPENIHASTGGAMEKWVQVERNGGFENARILPIRAKVSRPSPFA